MGSPSSFGRKRPFISLNSSASIENLSSSEGTRTNHAINDAQKGCAMQLNGITLTKLENFMCINTVQKHESIVFAYLLLMFFNNMKSESHESIKSDRFVLSESELTVIVELTQSVCWTELVEQNDNS